MNKRITMIFMAVGYLLINSCTTYYSMEFVADGEYVSNKPEPVIIGNWVIDPPRFSAYRDVVDLSSIDNPSTFWLAINGRHIKNKKLPYNTEIRIDSALIQNQDGEYFTVTLPTRKLAFEGNYSKYYYSTFDFYADQGVDVPRRVYGVNVSFVVKLYDLEGNFIEEKLVAHEYRKVMKADVLPSAGWR